MRSKSDGMLPAAVPALVFAGTMAAALLVAPGASAQNPSQRQAVSPRQQAIEQRARITIDASEGDRVVGGIEADPRDWPFQVALLATHILDATPESQFYALFCGGTLISPEWVLTAAHCLVDENNELFGAETTTVLVGTGRLTEGRRVAVVEEFVHENYHISGFSDDIGLLRLAEPITNAPVRLTVENLPFEGPAKVAGWGLREDGAIPLDMHEGAIDIVPNAACNEGIKGYYVADFRKMLERSFWYQRKQDDAIDRLEEVFAGALLDPLTDDMMCAGKQTGATDSCHGDSGGPLVVETDQGPLQVGIVSWGGGPSDAEAFCGFENAYGVYARVAHYADWIREKTGL